MQRTRAKRSRSSVSLAIDAIINEVAHPTGWLRRSFCISPAVICLIRYSYYWLPFEVATSNMNSPFSDGSCTIGKTIYPEFWDPCLHVMEGPTMVHSLFWPSEYRSNRVQCIVLHKNCWARPVKAKRPIGRVSIWIATHCWLETKIIVKRQLQYRWCRYYVFHAAVRNVSRQTSGHGWFIRLARPES